MSEQCAERCRVQLIADDDAGRTAALEVLVQILIRFAAGKGNDLRSDIGAELLLARGAFDGDVIADLAVTEADELQRRDIRSLMEQLIEGVLAVCARLAENDRSGRIADRLAEAVYRLAVGLPIQLLQMCREAAERL